jgi:hypothetical protein
MPYTKMGLQSKPIANMNNFQDINVEDLNLELIDWNVTMFKEINGL